MQILNAFDAVGPAISRTKLVLFSPFRMGRTWKLATTGYLAFAATFFLPFPLIYSGFLPSLIHSGRFGSAALVTMAIALGMALLLGFFYLCSRLEFAFFDIVLNRGQFVAPAWRKYGTQVWPWIGVKVVIGSIMTLLLAAPMARYLKHSFTVFSAMKPGQPPPPEFMKTVFGFEFGLFSVFAALFLFGSLLTDFVLPSLALESTTLAEAFRRFFRLMRREPGQIIGFVFMKVVLGIAGYIAQMILFYLLIFVFIIVMAIILGIGYLVLHAMHVPGPVMIVLAVVFGVVAYLFMIFYGMFLLFGTLLTFLQAYALYFLGGRYPLIGEYLERSTPPPVVPVYAYPYPPPLQTYPPPGSGV